MKTKFLIFILIAGLLAACGSQPAEAPAPAVLQPTNEPAPTDAPTLPATDTAQPPTDTAVPAGETDTASSEVSFTDNILPILRSRCQACHGGTRGTEEGLELISYTSLMAGSDNGPVIIPGDAEGSLLVELLVQNEMPKRGPKLTPPQVQLIIDWVNQGALNN